MKQPSTLVAAIATFCCSTLLQAQTDAINGANTDGIVLGVTAVEGCTYPLASNYDEFATVEDGSFQYIGCTNATVINYNPYANVEDGSCEYDTTTSGCLTDVDGDGATGTQDLLLFLGAFGQTCLD